MSMGEPPARLLVQPNLDLRQLQNSETYPTGTVEVTFSADNQPSYKINPRRSVGFHCSHSRIA